jgi:TrmH family RNA methyltransferase
MPSRITSAHNERIKYIRSLGRRRVRQHEGRFVVEGARLVDEVARAGIRPALALFTEAWAETPAGQRLGPLLAGAEDGDWLVTEPVLAACADTRTPQGVLVVLPFVHLEPRPGPILIVRSAEAVGVGQVILAPGTVDLYSPKVVRGAMGAHFRLPVTSMEWPAIAGRLAGRMVWLADAAGEVAYDAVDWTQPSALIVGGEAAGAGEEAATLATGRVSIPMVGGAESLNAAMAATVILFEAARQRAACGAARGR